MFATSQTHFYFNGNCYDQINGVAMGSSLASVLANLFMGHHERICLEQYKGHKVLFYRRYVDDTFCFFNNENNALLFFGFIISQHINMKFTMKREENHLDVLIVNRHLDFSVAYISGYGF